jgi:hypothetical protein
MSLPTFQRCCIRYQRKETSVNFYETTWRTIPKDTSPCSIAQLAVFGTRGRLCNTQHSRLPDQQVKPPGSCKLSQVSTVQWDMNELAWELNKHDIQAYCLRNKWSTSLLPHYTELITGHCGLFQQSGDVWVFNYAVLMIQVSCESRPHFSLSISVLHFA